MPLAHGECGNPQLIMQLKGQLAATFEARPLINAMFTRVHNLVEEAARRQQSLERLSEINRTSRGAKHCEASRLEKEVRCREARWSAHTPLHTASHLAWRACAAVDQIARQSMHQYARDLCVYSHACLQVVDRHRRTLWQVRVHSSCCQFSESCEVCP